jgi:hypothetical protein
VEVPLYPGGVVDHRVGRIDAAAKAAEHERDHRQRYRREKRITPRQAADPVEEAPCAFHPPGDVERGDHGERVTKLGYTTAYVVTVWVSLHPALMPRSVN